MIAFIDDHRGVYGVEPICKVLPIAPSTYHARVAQRADPTRGSARWQRDGMLRAEVRRVHAENFAVYGVRKVWRQLGREGTARRALHGRAADAPDGPARRGAREGDQDDAAGQGRAMPGRRLTTPRVIALRSDFCATELRRLGAAEQGRRPGPSSAGASGDLRRGHALGGGADRQRRAADRAGFDALRPTWCASTLRDRRR